MTETRTISAKEIDKRASRLRKFHTELEKMNKKSQQTPLHAKAGKVVQKAIDQHSTAAHAFKDDNDGYEDLHVQAEKSAAKAAKSYKEWRKAVKQSGETDSNIKAKSKSKSKSGSAAKSTPDRVGTANLSRKLVWMWVVAAAVAVALLLSYVILRGVFDVGISPLVSVPIATAWGALLGYTISQTVSEQRSRRASAA